jgi:hypothetical protein
VIAPGAVIAPGTIDDSPFQLDAVLPVIVRQFAASQM